ncbi:MAG: hypothetical protein Q7V58_06880 [Actinomycetota bacterium]|nr:hypothetical protein [Actinomycetota bacterium]
MEFHRLPRTTEEALTALGELSRELTALDLPVTYFVVSSTTIVEVFVGEVLDGLVATSGADSTRLGRALLGATRDDFSRNWPDRLHWLNQGFGIEIGGSSEGQAMLALVELRNAAVHAGGRLTARQLSDPYAAVALGTRLRSVLKVQVEGGELRYLPGAAQAAVTVARRFVEWLNGKVRAEAGLLYLN